MGYKSSEARWHSGAAPSAPTVASQGSIPERGKKKRERQKERQEKKTFFAILKLNHILKVMPQYPYGQPGVSVAWSHLGMRTGNSANEGDRLGSCWARGRIRYGMGVAAEIPTFCLFFLFLFFFFFFFFSS